MKEVSIFPVEKMRICKSGRQLVHICREQRKVCYVQQQNNVFSTSFYSTAKLIYIPVRLPYEISLFETNWLGIPGNELYGFFLLHGCFSPVSAWVST